MQKKFSKIEILIELKGDIPRFLIKANRVSGSPLYHASGVGAANQGVVKKLLKLLEQGYPDKEYVVAEIADGGARLISDFVGIDPP